MRQVLSTSILLVFSVIGAVVISAATFLRPNIEEMMNADCVARRRNNASLLVEDHNVSAQSAVGFGPATAAGSGCIEQPTIDEECALGLFESLPILVGSTVLIIIGHIIIFILAPVLAVLLERPRFFYERELSIFLKLVFFQVRH